MPPEELTARCKALGLPLTIQRRAVLDAVAERHDHPTAEDVFQAVTARLPGLSRATVYRTLERLASLGILARVEHPGAAGRYDARAARHHHLTCSCCGEMVDLDLPALDALPIPAQLPRGFVARDYSVHFRGLCGNCSTAARETNPDDKENI